MKLLDLFAGIGGFSYAAHLMGWETIAFVEWDEFNQKVLAKNFPGVPIHGDIHEYKGQKNAADIICGGFPCQPFSTAGKRQGTNDVRYLWPEMLRIIREVQPTYVIGENVAGIYSMDDGCVFEKVCVDLENEGYAVQPFRIPACATGAPHRRDRWWFVGYSQSKRCDEEGEYCQQPEEWSSSTDKALTDSAKIYAQRRELRQGQKQFRGSNQQLSSDPNSKPGRAPAAVGLDMEGNLLVEARRNKNSELSKQLHNYDANPNSERLEKRQSQRKDNEPEFATTFGSLWSQNWLQVATRLCRVDDGLPSWVDRHRTNRLKSLGNAIVPQVALELFKAIDDH